MWSPTKYTEILTIKDISQMNQNDLHFIFEFTFLSEFKINATNNREFELFNLQ